MANNIEELNINDEKLAFDKLKDSPLSKSYYNIFHEIKRDCKLPIGRTFFALQKLIEDQRLLYKQDLNKYSVNPPSKIRSLQDLMPSWINKQSSNNNQYDNVNEDSAKMDWNAFRKLIDYYIESLRISKSQQTINLNDKVAEFNYSVLNSLPLWLYSIQEDVFYAEISLTNINFSKFIDSKDPLSIGYPIVISSNKKDEKEFKNLVPIFYFPIQLQYIKGKLIAQTKFSKPLINFYCLNKCFKDDTSKQNFIMECDSACINISEDSTENLSGYNPTLDKLISNDHNQTQWQKLINTLEIRCDAPIKIKEHLNYLLLNIRNDLINLDDGIYNQAVIISNNDSTYIKSSILELEAIKNYSDKTLEHTALKYVFIKNNQELPKNNPENLVMQIQGEGNLNKKQSEACVSLSTYPLSAIQGPPGTGKTHLIAIAAANFRLYGQSAIVSSTNHQAINSVMERQLSLDDSEQELITRANDKQKTIVDFMQSCSELNKEESNLIEEFKQKQKIFDEDLNKLKAGNENLCLLKKYDKQINDLDQLIENEVKIISEKFKEYKDIIYKFQDIIIKSNTDSNISLIENIENSYAYLAHLPKSSLIKFIYQIFSKNFRAQKKSLKLLQLELGFPKTLVQSATRLIHIIKAILELNSKIPTIKYSRTKESFNGLKRTIEIDSIEKYEKYLAVLEEKFQKSANSLFHTQSKMLKTINIDDKKAINRANNDIKFNRSTTKDLDLFYDQKYPRRKEIISGAKTILKHFPVWACSTLSVRKNIPFIPALFDIAIFDESAQVDLMTAIPIMFRAKRVAVIGDPKQLPPIQSLKVASDQLLLKKYDLDKYEDIYQYTASNNTLYSLISGNPITNNIMLTDSYRCCQQILDYISEVNYEGKLQNKIVDKKFILPTCFKEPGIIWRNVKGSFEYKNNSRRCQAEAAKVIELLTQIFANNDYEGTVGVISPYKEQIMLISRLLDKDHDLANKKTAIHIGTIHSFQGAENDCIILSLCMDDNHSNSFLENSPEILNVAASRAKGLLIIVGNRSLVNNSMYPHIFLLSRPFVANQDDYQELSMESPYEQILYNEMCKLGLKPETQKIVGKRRLDFALIDENLDCKLDIEVDGMRYHSIPGLGRKPDDYRRDYEINKFNFEILRFWTLDIRENAESCAKIVYNTWNSMRQQAWKKKNNQ